MNKDLNEAHRAAIEEVAAIWREARRPIAMTGAGVSVPSGIPDFRSPGGLWEKHNPAEVATLQALRSRPARVWEFLFDALAVFTTAEPNPAHTALAELERAGRLAAVITQNIDGLHQAAGSRNVIEFHGNSTRLYCMRCKRDHDPALAASLTPADLPWECSCGGVVRPDIVFFGEQIPKDAMARSLALAQEADLVVVVGTSGEVAPANTIPGMVKSRGGKMVEINRDPSSFGTMADVAIRAGCEAVLPAVAKRLM
ncbi:MAG: SIR2 family NAD-dependent protein deacylase [Oceanidesulfovibrio sp.]